MHHLPSVQRTAFPSVSGHGFDRHARATAAGVVSGLPAGSHCLSPRHRHAGLLARGRGHRHSHSRGPDADSATGSLDLPHPGPFSPRPGGDPFTGLAAHSDRSPPHLSRAQPGRRLSRHRRGLSSRDSLRLQRPDRSLECPVARGIHLRRLAGPGIGAVQPHRATDQPAPGCRLPSPERARRGLAASPPNHQGSPGEP